MKLNRLSLIRYLTPGIIVAMVVGFSFVIPATANEDKNNQCGYGYGNANADNDVDESQGENNNEQCGEVGDVQDEQADTSNKNLTADKADNGGAQSDKANNGGAQTVTTAAHSDSGDNHQAIGENTQNGGGGN